MSLVIGAIGCGDSTGPGDAGADGSARDTGAADANAGDARPDAAPVDSGVDSSFVPASIGEPCPMGNECGRGHLCVDESLWHRLPPEGYCTLACVTDEDCGPDALCSRSIRIVPIYAGAAPFCFPECTPDGGCERPDRVCGRYLYGEHDLGREACVVGDPSAHDGSPCETVGDCGANQRCEAPNPFDYPGGLCRTRCTAGDDSTCRPAPGEEAACDDDPRKAFCLESCETDADCSRRGEGYRCEPVGDKRLCIVPHAPVGSACATDPECGPAETPWRCLTGPRFPGGYCSGSGCSPQDPDTCPLGSVCYDATPRDPASGDEHCTRDCDGDDECRAAEGYRCLPVLPQDPLHLGCRLPS